MEKCYYCGLFWSATLYTALQSCYKQKEAVVWNIQEQVGKKKRKKSINNTRGKEKYKKVYDVARWTLKMMNKKAVSDIKAW